MSEERVVPDFRVKVNGQPLPATLANMIRSIEVQQSLHLVDQAIVELENPDGVVADAAQFAKGAEVEIEVGWVGALAWAFKGDIISLEPDFPVGGNPTVRVRAYDRLHRYRRGRKQRTFLNQKVSDVVSSLAREEGLQADVEATTGTHEYLLQNNQTNIDFIHELARRHGYEVDVVDGRKLLFKKPRTAQGKAHTLAWFKELKSFYVRKSLANVPTEVTARYWDMKQKEAVIETQKDLHGSLEPKDPAPTEAKKAFGDAKLQVSLRPGTMPDEAKALAWGLFNEHALDAVKGRGTCVGDTAIKPGIVLELTGLGKTWSGLYYVTQATHLRYGSAGYVTEFEVRRNGTGYDVPAQQVNPPGAAESSPGEQPNNMSVSVSRPE